MNESCATFIHFFIKTFFIILSPETTSKGKSGPQKVGKIEN